MVRTINTLDDLRALKARSARRHVHGVALELLSDATVRRHLEARVNRSIASCGCGTGAGFVSVGLVIAITRSVFTSGALTAIDVVRAMGLLLATGLVGKIVGLLGAEFRLRTTIDEIVEIAQLVK